MLLRGNKVVPTLFIAFLGLMYYSTYSIKSHSFGLLGPTFYPRLLIGVLLLLMVGIIAEDSIKERKMKERGEEVYKGVTLSQGIEKYLIVILIFIFSAAYILLMDKLGYIISTVLFLVGMSLLLKPNWKEKLPLTVGLMVVFTLVLYYIFNNLLYIILPTSIFF
ncbi:MAG: tripartite tricarboxylate transporter TctB family protein [Clostridia bacterium]|nr:tripartite tricarboxylate transporter TctB family protein [Clostridia bacterium]